MDDEEVPEQKPFARGRRLASLRANQKIFLQAGADALDSRQDGRANESDNEYEEQIEASSSDDEGEEDAVINVEGNEAERPDGSGKPKKSSKRRGRPVQIVKCKSCKVSKRHRANGYCKTCYTRTYQRSYTNLRKCSVCGEIKNHAAKGMCINCYNRVIVKPKQKAAAYKDGNLRECSECGQMKRHEAKGLCKVCYERVIRGPKMRSRNYSVLDLIECSECGERRKHAARGLCRQCYNHNSWKKMSGKTTAKKSKCKPVPTSKKAAKKEKLGLNDDENARPSSSRKSNKKPSRIEVTGDTERIGQESSGGAANSVLNMYDVKVEQIEKGRVEQTVVEDQDVKPPLDEILRQTCRKALENFK